MHIIQETLRKYCRTAYERSPGIDGKHRTRRGKWLEQPCSFHYAVALAVHWEEMESLNSLLLGVLKIKLIHKFYTFLITQINIILHYCLLRIIDSLIGGAAAHPQKLPLVISMNLKPQMILLNKPTSFSTSLSWLGSGFRLVLWFW